MFSTSDDQGVTVTPSDDKASKYEVNAHEDGFTDNGSHAAAPVDDEFEAAQDEWDAVATITIGNTSQPAAHGMGDGENVHISTKPISTPQISFSQAITHFESHSDLEHHKKGIEPTLQYTGFRRCINMLFGPPKLHANLIADRDILFAMAAWKLDNDELVHFQMLQTVYKKLTGAVVDPPRYGNHWDDIGFQGTDPATDLRGGGCLGLVNLLYLTSSPKYGRLSRAIYTLSRHGVQNFPFSVMGLNITRMAMQALRAGLLNKRANKQSDYVINLFHDFYVACYLHLYLLWKDGNKTIHDSGYVVKETETYCCKNVDKVLQQLNQYITTQSAEDPEPMAMLTNMDDLGRELN